MTALKSITHKTRTKSSKYFALVKNCTKQALGKIMTLLFSVYVSLSFNTIHSSTQQIVFFGFRQIFLLFEISCSVFAKNFYIYSYVIQT